MYGIPLLCLLMSGSASHLRKDIINRLNSPISKQFLENLFKELLILENFPNLLVTDFQEEDKFKWTFNAIRSLEKLSEASSPDYSDGEISVDFSDEDTSTDHFGQGSDDDFSFDFDDISESNDNDDFSFDFDEDDLILEYEEINDDGFIVSQDETAYEEFKVNLENNGNSHLISKLIFALKNQNSPLSKKILNNAVQNLGITNSAIPYLEQWLPHLKETYTGDLKSYKKSGDNFVTENLNLDSSSSGPVQHQVAFKLATEIVELINKNSKEIAELKLLLTQRLAEANYSDMLFNRPYKILNNESPSYNVNATFCTILKPLNNMTPTNRFNIKQKYLNDLSMLNRLSDSAKIFQEDETELTVEAMFRGGTEVQSIDGILYEKGIVEKFVVFFNKHNINIMQLAQTAPRTFGTLYELYWLFSDSPPLSSLFSSIKDYLNNTCPVVKLDDSDLLSRHNSMKSFNESRLSAENELMNQLNDLFVSKMLFPSLVLYKNSMEMLVQLYKTSNNLTLKTGYARPSEKLIKASILFWRCLRER